MLPCMNRPGSWVRLLLAAAAAVLAPVVLAFALVYVGDWVAGEAGIALVAVALGIGAALWGWACARWAFNPMCDPFTRDMYAELSKPVEDYEPRSS